MYIAQQIAAQAVEQVLAGHNLTLALPLALAKFPNTTSQQRGAAADLSYGTLRFFGEVEAYLAALLEKPLPDARIDALLLVAIYQLLHDKAESFTVVNQAVHAVSQLKKPAPKAWAKGLVNGVLRNFLRQKDILAQHLQTSEVALYSYPQWWIDKLKAQYPHDWQNILLAGNQHPPMTLRVNVGQISVENYLLLLSRQDISAQCLGAQAVVLAKPVAVEKIPGFADGIVSVQDYGAQFAARLLDLSKPEQRLRVLDACCAPGGKTGHILEQSDVDMTALDNDATRLERVQSNLSRLNLHANLMVGDASATAWWDGKPFDRILADVPCTASGIVRRHVDIKWLRREADVASFAAQQAKILTSLWQLLAKGGKLLYATCSVFHEENQQQIERFLQQQTDATQLPLEQLEYRQDGQLIPCAEHDGFFYALLQKN